MSQGSGEPATGVVSGPDRADDLADKWLPLPAGDPTTSAGARRFRDVLGRFATGVAVVTSMADGEPVGMTCQSFSSVSLDPPLVLFCVSRTSRSWPLMRRAGCFAVNLLAEDQAELSTTMATRGVDKFAGVVWKPSPVSGAPILAGGLGWVDCALHAVHHAGDHHVVVGHVQDLDLTDARDPLLFFRGHYAATRPPVEMG